MKLGFTEAQYRKAARKVGLSCEDARNKRKAEADGGAGIIRNAGVTNVPEGNYDVGTPGSRHSMEMAYKRVVGAEPPMEEQGGQALLNLLWDHVSKGHVPGGIPLKKILANMPDHRLPAVRHKDEEVTHSNKEVRKQEVSYAELAYNLEQWMAVSKVWRTSLLMCIYANSQHAHLQVNKQVIDDLYAHLEGDQIARNPQS